jgi:hypothetical protein
MIKREWGVVCADCKSFIAMNTYEVERPEIIGVDVRFSESGESITCPKCRCTCVYSERDIQHRNVAGTAPR